MGNNSPTTTNYPHFALGWAILKTVISGRLAASGARFCGTPKKKSQYCKKMLAELWGHVYTPPSATAITCKRLARRRSLLEELVFRKAAFVL